jgi:hypothetical protein
MCEATLTATAARQTFLFVLLLGGEKFFWLNINYPPNFPHAESSTRSGSSLPGPLASRLIAD